MRALLLLGAASLALAGPAYAGQPVTINNAANTDSVTVTSHKLDVNATFSPSGTQDVNVTKVNGTTALAGAGATGAGSLRVTVAQDATTVAGGSSLPAGTAAIGALTGDTHAQCGALCANLVVKASSGVLKTFEVSADSTLSGAIWYVIVYDATSAPVDGAVTPAKCYQQASGTTQMGGTLGPGGTTYATGITIGVSTTGCFTKTASTHAYIAADFQ